MDQLFPVFAIMIKAAINIIVSRGHRTDNPY